MSSRSASTKIFIDLNDHPIKAKVSTDSHVKLIQVTSFQETKPIIDLAYRGNLIIMDFSHFFEDENNKRDMVKYFVKVAADINGAFMENGQIMVLSGNGMPIDRIRLSTM